jgi:signal transduction histidine kinase
VSLERNDDDMLRALASRLVPRSRKGARPERVSILLPFLIISAGLGALAWRSYALSVRMESGANALAIQYARYAADITASRIDAAVRRELTSVTEEWQQLERYTETPNSAALRDWVGRHEWIISGIYVPDHDPASSVYASELSGDEASTNRQQSEFFTSTGTVTYTYDSARLLLHVLKTMPQQPPTRAAVPGSLPLQREADIAVMKAPHRRELVRLDDAFAFYTPLSAPLGSFATRATVAVSYVGTGWENQRVVSLWVSLAALTLLAIGAWLAFRGLKKEAETTKLRSALIANVSHELRTPLSMIRLGAETLKRGAKLKEKERQDLEDQILREVLHLSHLVENVLDVARIQHNSTKALAITPVHPRELITTLVNSYQAWIESKGFAIAVRMDDDVELQMWDRESVSRALLNLIDNAIKYSSEEKRIEVVLRKTDDHVVLEVRDRGIGIEAADLGHIFDPYYRAQFTDTQTRRGAGLGLTLVQQIVYAHGGRVEVESKPGVGSTFRMLFPRPSAEERVALAGLVPSKPVTS